MTYGRTDGRTSRHTELLAAANNGNRTYIVHNLPQVRWVFMLHPALPRNSVSCNHINQELSWQTEFISLSSLHNIRQSDRPPLRAEFCSSGIFTCPMFIKTKQHPTPGKSQTSSASVVCSRVTALSRHFVNKRRPVTDSPDSLTPATKQHKTATLGKSS